MSEQEIKNRLIELGKFIEENKFNLNYNQLSTLSRILIGYCELLKKFDYLKRF